MARLVGYVLVALSPSVWWPQDRAWVLATDIDGYNTYLAARAAATAAVSKDPRLDAVPADLDTPLDPSPWEPHAPQRQAPPDARRTSQPQEALSAVVR